MQTMTTVLAVTIPVNIENMGKIANVTEVLRAAANSLDKNDTAMLIKLEQAVFDGAKEVAQPTPRRRGPNKAKGIGEVVKAVGGIPIDTAPKDTSKPGTEVTQPAWKTQADVVTQPVRPPFLDRTADAKTKAA